MPMHHIVMEKRQDRVKVFIRKETDGHVLLPLLWELGYGGTIGLEAERSAVETHPSKDRSSGAIESVDRWERCNVCGRDLRRPSICRRCGKAFCREHASPYDHDCPGVGAGRTRNALVTVLAALLAFAGILGLLELDKFTAAPKERTSWNQSSQVIEVTDSSLDGTLSSGGLLVLDCFAEWCPPCRRMHPVVEEMATKYKGRIAFGRLDLDENPRSGARFGIRSIPTFIMFRDGEEVGRLVGAVGASEFESWVTGFLEEEASA